MLLKHPLNIIKTPCENATKGAPLKPCYFILIEVVIAMVCMGLLSHGLFLSAKFFLNLRHKKNLDKRAESILHAIAHYAATHGKLPPPIPTEVLPTMHPELPIRGSVPYATLHLPSPESFLSGRHAFYYEVQPTQTSGLPSSSLEKYCTRTPLSAYENSRERHQSTGDYRALRLCYTFPTKNKRCISLSRNRLMSGYAGLSCTPFHIHGIKTNRQQTHLYPSTLGR